MDRKRKRASASSVRNGDKVCITCYTGSEIEIFIVDLSCKGGGDGVEPSLRSPTLRIGPTRFDFCAFCVLGDTFYAFEESKDPHRKSIFKFPLPHDEANLKLEKGMLVETAKMRSNKISPIAILTPDGNILVFSSSIDGGDGSTFELYDTSLQVCTELPEIPSDWLPGKDCLAKSFNFFSRTVFFIEVQSVATSAFHSGMLTLDLGVTARNKRWKKLDNFFGGMPPRDAYLVKDTQLCMTPFEAYYIGDLACVRDGGVEGVSGGEEGDDADVFYNGYDTRCSYHYPRIPEMLSPVPEFNANSITLMGDSRDSGFRFCVLEIGLASDTMVLNEYFCNFFKCSRKLIKNQKKDKKEKLSQYWSDDEDQKILLPHSTMARSLKFSYHRESDMFCPYDFYSI